MRHSQQTCLNLAAEAVNAWRPTAVKSQFDGDSSPTTTAAETAAATTTASSRKEKLQQSLEGVSEERTVDGELQHL